MTARQSPIILQQITCPEADIPTDEQLYLHTSGDVALTPDGLHYSAGASARFDTYVNLFNLGNWTHFCHLDGLHLHLTGHGQFTLHVWLHDGTTDTTLVDQQITLTSDGFCIDIDHQRGTGLIMFALTAVTSGQLTGGYFGAPKPAQYRPVTLALVITTFKREAQVTQTANRIAALLDQPTTLPGAHLFIIDNGQSLTLPDHPRITLLGNPNLGGAGGFARGLCAAIDQGSFSHVLFMDDDATFQTESLHRTCAFLAVARDPATALAGAMLITTRPWQLWENGAVFNETCHPAFFGTDLRQPQKVAQMELAVAQEKPLGFYGGWWYFAFPIKSVAHFAFPFFVRGDDVSFALSNPFRMATLNGVVSIQDDFTAKASPQTAYLDLRYHLHVHLVQNGMQLSALGTARIAIRLILRSVMLMHYETAQAQLLSWSDVLQGPDFFRQNIDMKARRATLSALTQTERWQPYTTLPADPQRDLPKNQSLLFTKMTLAGHLIPFYKYLGDRVCVPLINRGKFLATKGAATAYIYNDQEKLGYQVVHSKRQFLHILRRGAWLTVRWCLAHRTLRKAYRDSYDDMTSRRFWDQAIGR